VLSQRCSSRSPARLLARACKAGARQLATTLNRPEAGRRRQRSSGPASHPQLRAWHYVVSAQSKKNGFTNAAWLGALLRPVRGKRRLRLYEAFAGTTAAGTAGAAAAAGAAAGAAAEPAPTIEAPVAITAPAGAGGATAAASGQELLASHCSLHLGRGHTSGLRQRQAQWGFSQVEVQTGACMEMAWGTRKTSIPQLKLGQANPR
jgi:hypothetical protein